MALPMLYEVYLLPGYTLATTRTRSVSSPTPPHFPPRLQRPSAAPSNLHRLTYAPSVCSAGHDRSPNSPPATLRLGAIPCFDTRGYAHLGTHATPRGVQATLREQRDPAFALPLEHARTTILGGNTSTAGGYEVVAVYTAPAIQDPNAIRIPHPAAAADDLRGCPPLTVSAGAGKGMEESRVASVHAPVRKAPAEVTGCCAQAIASLTTARVASVIYMDAPGRKARRGARLMRRAYGTPHACVYRCSSASFSPSPRSTVVKLLGFCMAQFGKKVDLRGNRT
ncbi:hypothetical protein K438DRAFT_1970251 [Mycena galopus ATCC 62051]|nr:hypothetical protein K438DRAFT_1970251 [Mycena galopus ATCC 62051]